MAHANLRTLDVDKIFVRDIFFKDLTNRPISANQFLLTRGDGGTYFGNLPTSTNSTILRSFNEFRAGPDIIIPAQNYFNTLWFEPGAGITYYSSIEGVQTKFWVAATAPEQITVFNQDTGVEQTLNFKNLPDDLVGGRTLFFEGRDELEIYISDTTIVFATNNASTFSTIMNLQSTTEALYEEVSTMVIVLSTLIWNVDTLLLSTGISTLWSTLIYTKDVAEDVSTFVYSTFSIDADGTLIVNVPDVFISSLTVNEFNGPIVSTFSTLYWSVGQGLETTASSLRVSTIMGYNEPIITFDMANRRLGVNLGPTQQPRTTVDVGGIVFANNFVTSSDRRLKKDLAPLTVFDSLPAYEFTWIKDNKRDIGFMADDVERVAPACVYTDDAGYKAVDYSKLVPYTFGMISELQTRVSTLEARLAAGGL